MNTKIILIAILAGIFLLLALLIWIGRKKRDRLPKSLYIEALYALLGGNRKLALSYLKDAVKKGENRVGAYILLGKLLRENGQPLKALQIHRSMAIRKDISDVEKNRIKLAIARDLAALGRTDEAIDLLEAIKNIKRNREALLTLNRLNHLKGNFKKAYRNIKAASELDLSISKDVVASYLVSASSICLKEKRIEESLKYSDLALKYNSDFPSALYMSGKALVSNGRKSRAIEKWVSLLKIDISFFSLTIRMIEETLFEEQKFQQLETILNDLYQQHSGNPDIFISLVSFYEKKGQPEKVIRLFENEAGQLRINNLIKIEMALIYINNDRVDKAIQTLRIDSAEKKKENRYICTVCNNQVNIPLSYCENCGGIDTFRKYNEEIPD